ncbi:MAG: hormogonium polysaccharide biosynthesis protein HpsA [Nostoc sp. LLA-1]|nr:hormogonium polysaccharide biosynthesis protein HpsA [Cyanocohniella sp. LLY]
MSLNRQLVKTIKKIAKQFSQISKNFLSTINKKIIWLLRTLFITKRRQNSANAGFVLPTVVMVSIVVVLLTTAILFRSFERAKNASNVRVNEVVLQAVTPALDRAKAKVTELFNDPSLPRAVPSDATLYNTIISKLSTYTLGDETPIKVGYDLNGNTEIEAPNIGTLESKEVLETAWKFPVDTDNDGKFDSFTLYGVYFRNPPYDGSNPARRRTPLEARTAPLSGKACDASGDTSASLVGGSSWYKVDTGELKKSFFIYAATVPITDIGNLDEEKYQTYTGNRGFSAIEIQQDRKQIPLTNNAVVYEDDLEITPGPALRLNGRIFTNSNFFTKRGNQDIRFYQVSSIESCYYERENGKIIVGGNVATNGAIAANEAGGSLVDLYKDNGINDKKTLATANRSTSNIPNEIAYNSQAYAERIDLLVNAQLARPTGNDPQVVKVNISNRLNQDPALNADDVRQDELRTYFRQRTRRVPFREVPLGSPGVSTYTVANVLEGKDDATDKSNDQLRPPDPWMYPTNANTTLTLTTTQLPAIDPDQVNQNPVEEKELGDRILVGNNLPELRWSSTLNRFVGEEVPEEITGRKWNSSDKTRTRTTRVKQLADLGDTGRDGYWERSAARNRADILDVIGGLRVITGAGVYSPANSRLPTPLAPTNNPTPAGTGNIVWSDVMPMVIPDPNDPLNLNNQTRGHLVMRATAVYHYNKDPYNPQSSDNYQAPIACISSYYNPTSAATAEITATTPGYDPNDPATAGFSNNGFSYGVPATTSADVTRGLTITNGLFSTTATAGDVADASVNLEERLKYQANLIFPNGEFVNPLLRQALQKATTADLTLSEQSAIDSTICALQIADNTLTRDNSVVPDQAIKETAFLDAREIKAIDRNFVPTGDYDLEIEQRQPLEIRATVLDLNLLRTKPITGTWAGEYLLPNSGIIYATRDDARPDRSGSSVDVSATDSRLDPNRRPNGIMLINGGNLSRVTNYRVEEKGLILTTNLPAYVKGDSTNTFNDHTRQEFEGASKLDSDWGNFYDRSDDDRDKNFACRPQDPRLPGCGTGETWRPASVIADAVTLLSKNFREGSRSDGDFDLRNNRTDTSNSNVVREARLQRGFWDNNFVTSRNFTDSQYLSTTGAGVNSSYFNNFVTPIQRRVNFHEYVMEMCFRLNVAECGENDWFVGYDSDDDPNNDLTLTEREVRSVDLPVSALVRRLVAGTTTQFAQPEYRKFPRRVAFKRNINRELVDVDGNVIDPSAITNPPIALGIVGTGTLGTVDISGGLPRTQNNTLWFTSVESTDTSNPPSNKYYRNITRLFYTFPPGADPTSQPSLEPILQINVPERTQTVDTSDYSNLTNLNGNNRRVKNTKWLPRPVETTFNLVIASGDTPTRVGNNSNPYFEINGGLHNFPRFLENWETIPTNITGSFIQFKRSAYATAPFQVLNRLTATGDTQASSLFSERNNTNAYYHSDSNHQGGSPFYMPPVRNWGFDVALLSQNPDLFAQRFVTPSTDAPDEFYREVSRDDRWVQALLCAVQETDNGFGNGFNIKINPSTTQSTKYAIPEDQRPSSCPITPN